MKRHLLLGAATAALLASPALAGERFEAGPLSGELSANVGMTTDYVFRGISQSDEGPAIQGGFDYATDLGFYVGTWGSSIDFGNGVEIDYYGGYANSFVIGGNECFDKGSLTSKTCGGYTLSYDVGAIYYSYPHADDDGPAAELDFYEIYGKLGLDLNVVALETGLFFSPDATATDDVEYYYYYGSVTVPLPDGILPVPVSLDGRVGFADLDVTNGDYTEWEVGLNVTAFTLDWRVAYTDTTIGAAEAAAYAVTEDNSDGRVYFSVGKSW